MRLSRLTDKNVLLSVCVISKTQSVVVSAVKLALNCAPNEILWTVCNQRHHRWRVSSCRTFSSVTRWTKLAIRPTQYMHTNTHTHTHAHTHTGTACTHHTLNWLRIHHAHVV